MQQFKEDFDFIRTCIEHGCYEKDQDYSGKYLLKGWRKKLHIVLTAIFYTGILLFGIWLSFKLIG